MSTSSASMWLLGWNFFSSSWEACWSPPSPSPPAPLLLVAPESSSFGSLLLLDVDSLRPPARPLMGRAPLFDAADVVCRAFRAVLGPFRDVLCGIVLLGRLVCAPVVARRLFGAALRPTVCVVGGGFGGPQTSGSFGGGVQISGSGLNQAEGSLFVELSSFSWFRSLCANLVVCKSSEMSCRVRWMALTLACSWLIC